MKSEKDMVSKENEIMVSVCCATYNHEKYIEQALQGFVNQITDFRFEVIVHEDVSIDKTRSIVQKYVEKYPDIFVPIFQKENQYSKGYAMPLRNMLPKARGKYIAFCEGDDYWSDEHKLQKQYEIMEKNTQCSICVHGIKHVFEDRTLVDKPTFRTRGAKAGYNIQPGPIEQEQMALAVWVLGGYPFHTSSYFIRKSALNDWINEKTDFMKYMNGDLSLLRFCLLHGSFYYMDEVMSCRRRGVSGSWSARWVQGDRQVRLKHYQNLIIGERKFDEYSAYRFHEYIQQHLFNLIAECCVYDTGNIRKLLKENPLSIKIVKDKSSFWMYMRYLIIKMSPQLYKGLFDIQTRMMKNKQ